VSKIEDKVNAAWNSNDCLRSTFQNRNWTAQKKRAIFNSPQLKEKMIPAKEAGLSYAIGYISGFLIYIVLFIYGTMVMRGVMEEKVNRIAE
jgi:ABC-2 type transport system permease protein